MAGEVGALVGKSCFLDDYLAARFEPKKLVEHQRFQAMENRQLEDIA